MKLRMPQTGVSHVNKLTKKLNSFVAKKKNHDDPIIVKFSAVWKRLQYYTWTKLNYARNEECQTSTKSAHRPGASNSRSKYFWTKCWNIFNSIAMFSFRISHLKLSINQPLVAHHYYSILNLITWTTHQFYNVYVKILNATWQSRQQA